jgi:hypothetical protein
MPASTATILIPDISGFTEFMTTTELEHGAHIISSFLETIVKSADENFEVSEIEGDAVLLYKKGEPISRKELLDQCLKIFNAFHYQRKLILAPEVKTLLMQKLLTSSENLKTYCENTIHSAYAATDFGNGFG